MRKELSYSEAGVDIDSTDALKRRLAVVVDSGDHRVLNRFGAFASLVEGAFPDLAEPVLVLKMEEPGSKQKIAVEHDRIEGLAQDLVHHLVNDVVVMGAHPLFVLDCIVCGSLGGDVVERLVKGMAAACRAQGAVLVGGETSVQPGVLPDGQYVLSAAAVGVVERARIIDGSRIRSGDAVLSIASNGLHTNGYSLVRELLDRRPALSELDINGTTFLDAILRPHMCYYPGIRDLFPWPGLHGLAHITGGGIRDNLARILPPAVDVRIDLSALRIPEVFRAIRAEGDVSACDMLRTFNLGCGMIVVCDRQDTQAVIAHLAAQGHSCWQIGEAAEGRGEVEFTGDL